MGRILGAAVVPSAPLVLPSVAPSVPAGDTDEVSALRAAAADAVARLPEADAVVLLGGGRRSIHASARVDLGPLGLPEVTRTHPVAAALLPDLTSRTQYAQRHGDDLEIDLAVLALQLPVGATVVPIAVAPAEGSSLAASGRAIASAVRDGDLDVTLLCAGDLSTALDTSSPSYEVDGAAGWDEATVAAVRAADVAGLVGQGEAAARVHARSWGPLVLAVAAARASGLRPAGFRYLTARGVGHVVGSFARP